MKCAVCYRPAGPWAWCNWKPRRLKTKPFAKPQSQPKPLYVCSPAHLDFLLQREGTPVSYTDEQTKAFVTAGGAAGGSYLESIGKFNLAELTEQEWDTFCASVIAGYIAAADAAIPY